MCQKQRFQINKLARIYIQEHVHEHDLEKYQIYFTHDVYRTLEVVLTNTQDVNVFYVNADVNAIIKSVAV